MHLNNPPTAVRGIRATHFDGRHLDRRVRRVAAIDSAGKRGQHDSSPKGFNAAPVIGNNVNDYDLEKGDSYVWICRKPTAFTGAFLRDAQRLSAHPEPEGCNRA